MITKKTLMNMNKKEIESLLNSVLIDFNETSIEQSEIKEGMFRHLKSKLSGLEILNRDYHYNAFVIKIDNIKIVVKSSVKSTGKIIKVSKLRSKLVKGKGKFKIDYIEHGICHLCYEFSNEKTWEIKIDKNYTSTGDPSSVNLSHFNFPLKEMINVEFLVNTIDNQETNNKYRENEWKGFKKELAVNLAQPVLKKMFSKLKFSGEYFKKSHLNYFPKPFFDKLPDKVSSDDLFDLVVDTVAEINKDLIDDVINNKTFIIDL